MNRSSSCHAIIVLFAAVVVTAVIPVCSEAISFQHKFATDAYDGVGNVTNRLFTSGKSQALVWDGLGRLVRLTQRENPTNGFNWTAAYDALGRRLRTTQTPVVNGVTNSAELLTLDSYFDPEVEFLELAVGINGARTWKVLGLDGDEDYGGMQGVGGLEATIRESDGLITPVLNDYAGNVLATVSGGAANWNPVRVSGYGPVNGYQAATLSPGVPLAETLVWRMNGSVLGIDNCITSASPV